MRDRSRTRTPASGSEEFISGMVAPGKRESGWGSRECARTVHAERVEAPREASTSSARTVLVRRE
jgi:hypothetical protein